MTTIRRARPEDARGIHDAHMRSIREVCSRDHTPEEIAGWGNRPYRDEIRIANMTKDFVWVVEENEKILGFAHLAFAELDGKPSAEIRGLYLAPEAVGRDCGRGLMEKMLAEIKARGVTDVQLTSTLTAQGFYRRFGFRESGPSIKRNIGGSEVRTQPMRLES